MPLTNKQFLDYAGTSYLWSKIKTELDNKANASDLAAVATSGAAADISIADTAGNFQATTVEGALAEIGTAITSAGAVTLTESTSGLSDGILKAYTLFQNGQTIGTINIPKDLVATSGTIVYADANNNPGTFLQLTIANSDPVYINVASLVEYNGVADSAELTFTDTNHQISATINVGSIAKNKLASTVQASLTAADTALQPADITTGATNGTIAVNGTDISVYGLGTAAYTDAEAYDANGSATAVYNAIIALSNGDINSAIAAANNSQS